MNEELQDHVISPATRMAWILADNWCHPAYLMAWKPLPMKPVYSRVELSLN